ncbi:neurogenic differentiation factor 1-like [Macrosteles quadrilineatus]|uniref:neurogenic differentiation factor 1-like n=1 Tax=Macrosteles quadrilineatus TaxID=74068 RepID=UPI0023E131DB|nr:neurogenic differentiation factor 1-like [Macrosteles quadrilineatus]
MEMELMIDANNNSSEKSYSLRPRAAPKKDDEDSEDETSRPNARKKKKSKQKPGRLSKYRRKTANARERSRMREINEAFEALRRAIPHLTPNPDNGEKLTKISTLRLAMKYITALNNALNDSPGESDGESFFSDYSLTPSEPREHSMTPSSISDHSDFYDQFFQKSLSENISPCEPTVLNTAELTFPVRECDNLRNSDNTLRTLTTSSVPLEPLPPFYQVSTSILTPECDRGQTYHSTTLQVPETVFKNPFTPELQESPADLDSLLYPSLNFDELFIT